MPKRTQDSRIGKQLRANVERLLNLHELSPAEFCLKAGITRGAYSRLFKSPNGPRVATLEKIAHALGALPFELLLPPVYEAVKDDDSTAA